MNVPYDERILQSNSVTSEPSNGPLVTVILPTFNRRPYLPNALNSILQQHYLNLEVFVVNDGGVDVADIVNACNDERVTFINRKENRGKAYSLNEALAGAAGKYVAYLDDDDLFFPHHIAVLVDALEERTDCQVAYSDLYEVSCKILPDKTRQVLSKKVEISRDFDRFFMFYFNHVLHVCLMHRRDLLDKTGLYNENLSILIDWDITRRLAFFTDFFHVSDITGQYYCPVGQSDRISYQQRKDTDIYLKNLMAIRTSRPAKPWPKIQDLSIIIYTDQFNKQLGETIGLIWRHTFVPYKVYLSIPSEDLGKINSTMPTLELVEVNSAWSIQRRFDAVLERAEGEYIVVMPGDLPIDERWVEDSLYALINNQDNCKAKAKTGFLLSTASDKNWAVVVSKSDIESARRMYPALSIRESLEKAGIEFREPEFDELPFQFDHLLRFARKESNEGNWLKAAGMFEYIAGLGLNELWMRSLAAEAFYKAGDYKHTIEFSQRINESRPTVQTLLLEAKCRSEQGDYARAISLLEKAERILKCETNILLMEEHKQWI